MSRQTEILSTKPSFFYVEDNVYHEEGVIEAMTQYANEQSRELAIGFAEWCQESGWEKHIGESLWRNRMGYATEYTTDQLFDLYIIQSKTKEP